MKTETLKRIADLEKGQIPQAEERLEEVQAEKEKLSSTIGQVSLVQVALGEVDPEEGQKVKTEIANCREVMENAKMALPLLKQRQTTILHSENDAANRLDLLKAEHTYFIRKKNCWTWTENRARNNWKNSEGWLQERDQEKYSQDCKTELEARLSAVNATLADG